MHGNGKKLIVTVTVFHLQSEFLAIQPSSWPSTALLHGAQDFFFLFLFGRPSFVMLFVMFVMVLYCLCIVGNLRPFFVKKVIRINNPYDPYGLKND